MLVGIFNVIFKDLELSLDAAYPILRNLYIKLTLIELLLHSFY